LLLDLYDRKLISRSSLQLKMDLDPEIETSNRATEGKTIDLFDEKLVKPIVDMVMAGILSVERAQEMLGLPKDAHIGSPATEASLLGAELSTTASGAICDECSHFDGDMNRCRVHDTDRAFDAPACRFLDRREAH